MRSVDTRPEQKRSNFDYTSSIKFAVTQVLPNGPISEQFVFVHSVFFVILFY